MYCHKCGAQSAPGQQFCPQCGTKLILSGEPAQSQTSRKRKLRQWWCLLQVRNHHIVESADSVEFELADTGRPIGFPTGTHQVRDQHDRGCHRSRYRRCNNRIHWRRPVDNTLSFVPECD